MRQRIRFSIILAYLWIMMILLGSIIMETFLIVCEGLFSMVFFWPRNTIMFVEGPAVHTAEVLRQTAREFQSLHWGRVACNAAGAAFIFTGFLKFDRAWVVA